MDCSVRLRSKKLDRLHQEALATGGFLSVNGAGGSIYSYTWPDTFDYLPANHNKTIYTKNRVGTVKRTYYFILQTGPFYYLFRKRTIIKGFRNYKLRVSGISKKWTKIEHFIF